ncbi:MAG TPA: NADH-quinone oxidoreductase subunit M [Gemmataceae bacterium]|nr:NADH-quinone oxidoreductase subunit M [Gemmataceae bacterium]
MTYDLERNVLVLLLACPAVAAVVVAVLGPRRVDLIRWISFAASVLTLALAAYLAVRLFEVERQAGPPPVAKLPTFRPHFVPGARDDPAAGVSDAPTTTWNLLPVGGSFVQFYIGLDGLNVWLVMLTAVLMLPSVLVSWHAIRERVNEFYAWLLLLQTAMMGIFLSFDIILFYVFFEMSLVPLFFLIGIWGGPARQHAAFKFFIYTLTGSLISLLGILGIVLACQAHGDELTFSIPRLVEIVHSKLGFLYDPQTPAEANVLADRQFWGSVQFWVFLALTAGFAVKVPLVPLHTWLPLAHVEAPTAGSVDLAGVLLKIGAYGFLRLCVPLAPDVSLSLGLPLVSTLAAVGIVYGAYCAYAQDDVKRLIAYSSVSHLGLCMLGMFALNTTGIAGSLMQMINHGLSTGALFLLIGMLYDRYHTRRLGDFSGMAKRLPWLATFMVFICLSSVGLPGLNGFIGEVLVLMGVFASERVRGEWPLYAVIAASGLILGAWYLFTMLRRVFFGPLKEPHIPPGDEHGPVHDLDLREWVILTPIALLCVAIGLYPQPILTTSQRDIDVIVNIADRARNRASVAASPPLPEARREHAVLPSPPGEGEGSKVREAIIRGGPMP